MIRRDIGRITEGNNVGIYLKGMILLLMGLILMICISVNINPVLAALAPGYCPSYGGSHEYEYISNVTTELLPNGTIILTVTVNIYIANPTGCVAGEPCPEYDNSPEYVNVWIDWDGDRIFESNEKVLDQAGTGYLNINYQGTMSFVSTVTIPPNTISPTYMRTNLGWGHDPNDPCELSWTWGDVTDQEVNIPITSPQIEEIIITPNNPETTKDVTLEAIISDMAGYEITNVSWAGDLIPGDGNPYTYKPGAGTQGKKNVIATITYRYTSSGVIGQDSRSKEFNIFFDKDGDEDGNGTDNWYHYWSISDDGAASYNRTSAMYRYGGGSYGGSNFAGYNGNVTNPTYTVYNRASMSCAFNYSIPGYNFNNKGQGVDCVEDTLMHERSHHQVDANWQQGGIWEGMADSDNDELPDDWENTHDGFDPNNANSFTGFPYGDDEEVYGEIQGFGQTGTHTKDWANPGKQSDPSYKRVITETGTGASLTGNNLSYGTDINGNGLYDYLSIDVEVNVVSSGTYSIIGNLYDTHGNMLWDEISNIYLETGIQRVTLKFDGLLLHQRRVDGPYSLKYLTLFGNNFADDKIDVHTTSPYSFTDFETGGGEFTNNYSDYGSDTNGDGLYDYLNINIQTDVITSGEYVIEGWLYDINNNEIGWSRNRYDLTAGSQSVLLSFDGKAIRQHRIDGPYLLRSLNLYNGNNIKVDFIYSPYQTSVYSYTDFQAGSASLVIDNYTDSGIDTDNDGYYDLLRIETMLNVITDGNYHIIGQLYDSNGNHISEAEDSALLTTGNRTLHLDFDGTDIFNHSMNGPYNLKYILLYNESGILIDTQYDAYSTFGYDYTNFKEPLVVLTGNYNDYGTDTDGDGLFDYLTIDVEVIPANEGNVVVNGRLVDNEDEEILWTSNVSYLSAGQSQIIRLNFDGRYIYGNMQDGPYYLKDVYIYHTGDPSQTDWESDAYTTSDYDYYLFERSAIITGRVLTNNMPIPNLFLSIDGIDNDYTNSDGKYNLTILENGRYTVVLEASGYENDTWKIFIDDQLVGEGDSVDVDATIGEIRRVDFIQKKIIPGDLDVDGDIDSTDYQIFRSTLGKCSGTNGFIPEADYDGDGCVTYADYRIWYGYYNDQ
ncbi:MAG: carboxypeptidase-like regulatory domain-containing protein [Nitrospirota bacterium]